MRQQMAYLNGGDNMTVENVPQKCAIKVTCTRYDFDPEEIAGITSVRVYRTDTYHNTSMAIVEKEIKRASDLNIQFYDYYALNGIEYGYTIRPVVDGVLTVGPYGRTKCAYDGLYIGNLEENYIAALNVEYSHSTKFNKSYVQTYYSAYPHAIANGDSVYETGEVKGLFLEFDESQCKFDIEHAGEYKRKFKAFLAGKGNKVIKTREGDLWTVQIDGEVKESHGRVLGTSEITFSWTQVGPAPTQGVQFV